MNILNQLKIASDKVISEENLKHLKGGEAGTGQWMACSCDGGINPPFSGTWEKCYDLSDPSVMMADINQMCETGGNCENQHQWCLVSIA